jgi:hypothetical protein
VPPAEPESPGPGEPAVDELAVSEVVSPTSAAVPPAEPESPGPGEPAEDEYAVSPPTVHRSAKAPPTPLSEPKTIASSPLPPPPPPLPPSNSVPGPATPPRPLPQIVFPPPRTPEDNGAVKIQAMWRGKQERNSSASESHSIAKQLGLPATEPLSPSEADSAEVATRPNSPKQSGVDTSGKATTMALLAEESVPGCIVVALGVLGCNRPPA